MNRNYSGLTSIGSEIISSSLQSQRNLLFSAKKRPKLVVKSYKVTDDSSILDNKTNKNKNTKANRKKKIKSCESRKSISPKKKLQKKFNKIMSSTTIEKDLYRNNSAFNIIFLELLICDLSL